MPTGVLLELDSPASKPKRNNKKKKAFFIAIASEDRLLINIEKRRQLFLHAVQDHIYGV